MCVYPSHLSLGPAGSKIPETSGAGPIYSIDFGTNRTNTTLSEDRQLTCSNAEAGTHAVPYAGARRNACNERRVMGHKNAMHEQTGASQARGYAQLVRNLKIVSVKF